MSQSTRSKASKVILTLLSRIRKLSCDRSGRITRIVYVDKVFRDLYDVKNFARRAASCRRMSQVVQVFDEIGVKDLWNLLNDETFYEVLRLLIDVQERKEELKHTIKKTQKKLSSNTLRIDQKSKGNKKINKANEELKWLSKRYRDSIESLQDSLNIHVGGDDYKDRFAALKRFSEQGSIANRYWDMDEYGIYDDGDDYSMNFSRRRNKDPFDDIDFTEFEDEEEDRPRDRLSRLEDQISNLVKAIQMNQTQASVPPATKEELENASPMEKRFIHVIKQMGDQIDRLADRLDDLESGDDYEMDESVLRPGHSVQDSYDGPSTSDIEDMLAGRPVEPPRTRTTVPYVPNDPTNGGFESTASILKRTAQQESAKQDAQTAYPIHIDANPVKTSNRQEVFDTPTDYQVREAVENSRTTEAPNQEPKPQG